MQSTVRFTFPHQIYQSPNRAFSVALVAVVSIAAQVSVSGMGLARAREVRARTARERWVRKSSDEVISLKVTSTRWAVGLIVFGEV